MNIFTRACTSTFRRHPSATLFALDTETEMIKKPDVSLNGKARVSPPTSPRLVLSTLSRLTSDGITTEAFDAADTPSVVAGLLRDKASHIVFHNFPFDHGCLCQADPSLTPLFLTAIRAGRIYDTMNRELLILIARGRRDSVLRYPSLAELAQRHCAVKLNKDAAVRCTFDQFLGKPLSAIPPAWLEYAAHDTDATLRVFLAQETIMQRLHEEGAATEFPVAPDAVTRWGYLSEHIQLRGAVALSWLERFPVHLDLAAVDAARRKVYQERDSLEPLLISYGWARRAPKKHTFHLSTKAIREALAAFAKERNIQPEFTDTGLIKTDADFWGEHLPRLEPSEYPTEDTLEGRLLRWLRYQKLSKLLSTYLDCYAHNARVFPQYSNLFARTTRTTCSKPNVQNVPKHRHSLRTLFVPPPGYVFYEFDFKAAELAALAQVQLSMFGTSTLADHINAGLDPHVETAKLLMGPSKWESASKDEKARFRQAAKAVAFGLPGGLGIAKLQKYTHRSYGLSLSTAEVKGLKAQYLEIHPALKSYLQSVGNPQEATELAAHNLGIPVSLLIDKLQARSHDGEPFWMLATMRLRNWVRGDRTYSLPCPDSFVPGHDLFRSTTACLTGTVRGRASYTEGHNFPFQSLVAAGLKLGLFNLLAEHSTTSTPSWAPVVEVHDSVLIAVKEDSQDCVPLLAHLFCDGLQTLLPSVKAGVDVVGPSKNWSHK